MKIEMIWNGFMYFMCCDFNTSIMVFSESLKTFIESRSIHFCRLCYKVKILQMTYLQTGHMYFGLYSDL